MEDFEASASGPRRSPSSVEGGFEVSEISHGRTQSGALEGDVGAVDLETLDEPVASSPPDHAQRQHRPQFIDLPLPDLHLPDPALDVPQASAVRSSRTRSPALPAPVPLKPILQNPLTPSARPVLPTPIESSDHASIHRDRSPSPVFAPREDDEPHPEHGMHSEQRVPHPLYTPAPRRRRRRRRRNGSVASGRSSRSGKSARTRVKRALRKVHRRRRRGSTAGSVASGTASSRSSSSRSSGSSTTSSSSTSTDSSGRSNSTWAGWRFWRNSSSGSSSSDETETDTDSEWDPPTPHFTLLTPVLSRPTLHYPAHLFSGATPTPAAATPLAALAPDQAPPVFELANSAALAPALDRLGTFWRERQQEDGVAGDLGAGFYNPGEAPLQDMPPSGDGGASDGYFPPDAFERAAAAAARPDDSPFGGSTPAVTPGVLGGPSTKRGREQARTARLEFRRLGKNREMRNGPAWWLDIMCPSVADMRDLRKHLPLHPLTIEDILHQETREKLESFPALGYYFIVFRALDESYFRYTSTSQPGSPSSSSSTLDEKKEVRPAAPEEVRPKQRGRVDIVEGVGGKEGVEGVGVGAVNMYLVVFGDGILSFHFEPIDKHLETVQGKLQQYGNSRNFSSHWMAYSLMDSVVDAFFPIMDFVDTEADELDVFSVGPKEAPNGADPSLVGAGIAPSGLSMVAGQKVYDESVVGIRIEDPTKEELEKVESAPSESPVVKRATVERIVPAPALRGLTAIPLPTALARILPKDLLTSSPKAYTSNILVDDQGIELQDLSSPPKGRLIPDGVSISAAAKRTLDTVMLGKTPKERAAMLQRITQMRRIVTGLSRLLGPKTDVVRGLRKRVLEEDAALFRGDFKHDIAVYIGDLQDHILAMQQSLTFYDATLAHDHPAYLSILRFSLQYTKRDTDIGLIKLYLIGMTVLLLNIITGLFSVNVDRPHNGTRDAPHVDANGETAPLNWWGIVVGILVVAALCLATIVYFIFRSSQKTRQKRGPALR
ncbi:hypothetical protein JCM8202v2_004219 [Rhodotorula sphaerocarpa]